VEKELCGGREFNSILLVKTMKSTIIEAYFGFFGSRAEQLSFEEDLTGISSQIYW
jgi:hypothetical protein